MNKTRILSIIVCSTALSTTAQANVKGMTSEQLASFANESTVPTVQSYDQGAPRSINTLSQSEQAYILSQVARLNSTESQSVENSGFTTVTYKPRASRINKPKIENELRNEVETSENQSNDIKANKNTAQDENWMLKIQKSNAADLQALQALIDNARAQQQKPQDQSMQQKRNIQVGHFYSPQVQQSYNVPSNNFSINLKPSSSKAPTIGTGQFYARGPATIECVIQAANKQNVPAHVLLGIASKEYGRNGQTVRNTDSSYDMGHFQLNTIHFRRGEAFSHINVEDAKWRGCYNAELAAWHLNRQLTRKGKESVDFWTRAGGYHSWTPNKNHIYVHGTANNRGMKQYAQEWLNWLNKNTQYQVRK